jgi:hypothetical protein
MEVVFSPDGRRLASVDGGEAIRLWDAATLKELRRIEVRHPRSLAFSPDGTTLAAGCDYDSSGARLWDVNSGEELLRLDGEKGALARLAFSPDGRTLASGGEQAVRLWEVCTGRERASVETTPYWLSALAFLPDGRSLAGAGEEKGRVGGHVRIWELAGGRVRFRRGYQSPDGISGLAVTADGRTLITGGSDQRIRVWDLAAGRQVREFGSDDPRDLASGPQVLALTPAGDVLAVANVQLDEIYLWDLATGRELAPGEVRRVLAARPVREVRPARVAGGVRGRTAAPWRPGEGEALWADLGGRDARRAYRVVWALADAPGQALPFLRARLPPAAAVAPRVPRLIADLDADAFPVRERATAALGRMGRLAEPALREALRRRLAPEARRRVEQLLETLNEAGTPPEQAREVRAVEALEQAGTREAEGLLRDLARGAPEALLTREAKASLERLDRRRAAP